MESDYVIVTSELPDLNFRKGKTAIALFIMGAIIILTVTGLVPIMTAALVGAAAMVIARCISLEEAYGSIDWKIIFLLGGIIPLGVAMENNGVIQALTGGVLQPIIGFGPIAVLAVLYLVVALLTEGMSNNAVAAILAPIALSIAAVMNVNPQPFLVAITFAASTSFATPIGYQTNTMVFSAGGYKFTDFARAGIPLNIVFWIIATLLIPVIWPF